MTVPSHSRLGLSGKLAVLTTTLAAAFALPAHSVHAQQTLRNIDFGYAAGSGDSSDDSWAIFTFGANANDSDAITSSTIHGDLGAAGSGILTLSGVTDTTDAGATTSNAYYSSNGTFTGKGFQGTKFSGSSYNSLLNSGIAGAKNASLQASALSSSPAVAVNASGYNDTAANGQFVLNISNFNLTNDSSFTLNGTAQDSFIFNISGTFSLANTTIHLTGGLTASNVLFNYTGSSQITITGGTTNGIILAASTGGPNQSSSNWSTTSVSVSGGATINGEIIADKVSVAGGSMIQAVVSP